MQQHKSIIIKKNSHMKANLKSDNKVMSVNTLNDDKNILTVYMIVLHTEPLSISAFEMGRLTKDPACSLGKIELTPEAR